MVGIFERFYNHQGELRWKFKSVYNMARIEHANVIQLNYPEIQVHCNIKHHPRIGTYCKAPANYMRG
jgi:hypothetical protein